MDSQGSLAGWLFCVDTLRKILVPDNLRKRNVVVIEWCCTYKKSGEPIDHLLIYCGVARELWNSVLNLPRDG
jgi:hypothetical protein